MRNRRLRPVLVLPPALPPVLPLRASRHPPRLLAPWASGSAQGRPAPRAGSRCGKPGRAGRSDRPGRIKDAAACAGQVFRCGTRKRGERMVCDVRGELLSGAAYQAAVARLSPPAHRLDRRRGPRRRPPETFNVAMSQRWFPRGEGPPGARTARRQLPLSPEGGVTHGPNCRVSPPRQAKRGHPVPAVVAVGAR